MNEKSMTNQRMKDQLKNDRPIKESNVMTDELSLPTTVEKIKKCSNGNIMLKWCSKIPKQFVNAKLRRCIPKHKPWDKR